MCNVVFEAEKLGEFCKNFIAITKIPKGSLVGRFIPDWIESLAMNTIVLENDGLRGPD